MEKDFLLPGFAAQAAVSAADAGTLLFNEYSFVPSASTGIKPRPKKKRRVKKQAE